MYKETLDILMEDINDHNNIKENILKNQLKYHFSNKNQENESAISSAAVIVRRVLSNFTIGEIIGIQPVIDKDKPIIISDDTGYYIETSTRPLNTGLPEISEKDLETMNGLDLQCEINLACATEIGIEITNEILHTIANHAPEINITLPNYDDHVLIDTIENAVKEVKGNWIVVPPIVLAMLQSTENPKYKSQGKVSITDGAIIHVGQLNDDVKIYCNTFMRDNMILIGSKEPNNEDTPIVYAPETMLVLPDGEYEVSEDFTPLLTKHEIFAHPYGTKMKYRKISINFEING